MSREQFFKIYLRQSRKGIGIFFLFCAVFLCIFLLYDLPAGAVVYPALICSVLGAGVLVRGYYSAYQKHRELDRIAQLSSELMEHFPEKTTAADWDYQEVIGHLREEQRSLKNQLDIRYTDMMEYYTVWVHQIKTPIASMRLMLQNEDSDQARRLSEELSRIEQYVEMVLVYLRLDSESKDHVFRKCDLDQIVRGEVKKFAGQFIRRKIGLRYEPLGCEVLTDEKWLAFVVEQVISNALKYTDSGKISIYTQMSEAERPSELNAEDGGPLGEVPVPGDEESRGGGTAPSEDSCPEPAGIFLVIEDTGIGIAPEDLYRVFEKGFTGYNGRENKKATGLGLYLCRRILDKLSHTIEIESEPGRGTKVKIGLERYEVKGE